METGWVQLTLLYITSNNYLIIMGKNIPLSACPNEPWQYCKDLYL